MIGKTISRYKILEKLPTMSEPVLEGGMAVFDKDVDLKFKNIIVVNFYRFLTPLGV